MPEFLGGKATATFTGKSVSGTTPTLKAEVLGIEGAIVCEKAQSKGEIVNSSMEVKKVVVEYSGKCTETVGGTESACAEPIATKALNGVVGWIEGKESGPVGQELSPEAGTVAAETECGGNKAVVGGRLVGEYPAESLNVSATKFELIFEATGVKQKYSTLLLLGGAFDTGLSLQVEGLFGGEASQALREVITTSEEGEIKT